MDKFVSWNVLFHDEFDAEFKAMTEDVQDNLLAVAKALQIAGPKAGRPHVDTLAGSKHANMKELRTKHDQHQYRILFAFDTAQHAILLVGGDKKGADQGAFYRALIKVGDVLFDQHLARLKAALKKGTKP